MCGTVANETLPGRNEIKIQHFGLSLNFWLVIESIACKE